MAAEQRADPGSSFDLIVFLWKQRKLLIGITLLGAIGGAIASYVIPEKFEGEVILYPAITNSVSRSVLTEQSGLRDDLLSLGGEEHAEQLLQMLQSDPVRDRIIKTYDLMTVYGIDSNGTHKRADLYDAYKDHVTFELTKYNSVRIQVMDKVPERAANMANSIASELDSVWSTMQRERSRIGVELIERELVQAEAKVAWLNDTLMRVREAGVQDYHSQTERFHEYLGAAIMKGDQRAIDRFDERFKILARYGGAYLTLQGRMDHELWRCGQLRTKLIEARADLQSALPHKFVVDSAVPADKKAWPVRWLVTLISTASAFLLALLVVVVRESLNKIARANG